MTLRDDILSLLADGPRSQDAIVRQTREEDAELYTHCRLVTRALEQMASGGAITSEDRGGVLYWRLSEPKRDRLVWAVNAAGFALLAIGCALSALWVWAVLVAVAGLIVLGVMLWRTK